MLSNDSSLGLKKGSERHLVNQRDSPYPAQYLMLVFFIRMIDSAQAYDEEQVAEAVQEKCETKGGGFHCLQSSSTFSWL